MSSQSARDDVMPTLSRPSLTHNSSQRDIKHPLDRMSPKIELQKEKEDGRKMEREEKVRKENTYIIL
jgi:hypothetical protein